MASPESASRKWPRSGLALALAGLTTAFAGSAFAAPESVCVDVGGSLGLGISSYSDAQGWPEMAEANGVPWKFLYYYVFPSQDTAANVSSFIASKAQVATGLSSTMVITFYDLLKRGTTAGLTARPGAENSEADIVAQTLADPTLMAGYFDGFVVVLKAAAKAGVRTLVQVEPDSWGFMIWAMGVEGRTDPTTVPVAVVSSGQADLAGQSFGDDAAGFGRALLYLRDKYAPDAQMGWHASNFRAGSGGDVVAAFYSGVGKWDAIVTEDPHILSDDTNWWLPLSPSAVDANVGWFSEVSSGTGLPILMWQIPIGPFDYHLFGEGDAGATTLSRFIGAGLVGMLWEQEGTGDPDTFRGVGLATPPTGSPADGTALGLRTRLAAYESSPPPWPAGSPCSGAASTSTDAGGGVGGRPATNGDGGGSGANALGGSTGSSGAMANAGGAGAAGSGETSGGSSGALDASSPGGGSGGLPDRAAASSTKSGCGCHFISRSADDASLRARALGSIAALGLLLRRKRRRTPKRECHSGIRTSDGGGALPRSPRLFEDFRRPT